MKDPTDESLIKLPSIPMIAVILCVIAVIVLFLAPWIISDYAWAAIPTP